MLQLSFGDAVFFVSWHHFIATALKSVVLAILKKDESNKGIKSRRENKITVNKYVHILQSKL